MGMLARRRWEFLSFTLAAVTLAEISVQGADSAVDAYDLEALMNTKITTVSRKPEAWFDAASAVSVLTSDDIRRSGALVLPDALRYAPGLFVGRSVGNSYAVSSRGFTGAAGNKLQVLMDGRVLYSPLFSGVFWEVEDTLLEDVERIEVIRGPGAAQWGANAVNGVINIISKSARETQGTLIEAASGNEELGFGAVRYGAKAGESTYWRAYGKYRYRDEKILSTGTDADDYSSQYQAGFRTDTFLRDVHQITFQGDLFWNQLGLPQREDGEHKGGNIMGRWVRTFSEDSNFELQLYYDRNDRDIPLQYSETRDTFDVDFQHRFALGERNDIVWGGNYRVSSDDTGTGGTFQFDPESRTIQLVSGFIQDEITLIPKRLELTLGTKFEHNDFTGAEIQPSARLTVIPNSRNVLWAAVSRAVRTPTRIETDLRFSPTPGGVPLIYGNPDFESENLTAYELGYRISPTRRTSLEFSTFYNVYDHLRTIEPIGAAPFPLTLGNEREGNTYGFEAVARAEPLDWWELTASFSLLREDLDFTDRSRDATGGNAETDDARHMAKLRSSFTLPHHIEFDQMVRYMDSLPKPYVPSYTTIDLRLAWRPRPGLELSVVGANLLDPAHPEFSGGVLNVPEVQRSVYGKVLWLF